MSPRPDPVDLGKAWRRPLVAHVLALIVVLTAVAGLARLGTSFTSDEGAYALQVRALEHGHWDYRWPGDRIDPTGRWFPLVNTSARNGHYYPYVQHPLWPVLLRQVGRVGTVPGLYLLSMAACIAAAAAAWAL